MLVMLSSQSFATLTGEHRMVAGHAQVVNGLE